jgi:hypothetical protein
LRFHHSLCKQPQQQPNKPACHHLLLQLVSGHLEAHYLLLQLLLAALQTQH